MRYSVTVDGEDGEAIRKALVASGIWGMGPAATGYGGGSDAMRVGGSVIARVDADSPEEAETVARCAVVDLDDVTVGTAREWTKSPPGA